MRKILIGLLLLICLCAKADNEYIQTEYPPLEDKENELAYFVSISIPVKQLVTLIR